MKDYSEEEAVEVLKKLIMRRRRTVAQNSRMWAMLGDVSDQVMWHGQKLSKKDWKWIFTAAVKGQRMVPGIDGGLVYLGEPTSSMTKGQLSELIDCIGAFGDDHDVVWTEEQS